MCSPEFPRLRLFEVALLPAHNEESSLPATIASLRAQASLAERLIVVADDCTDHTVRVAREAGMEVFGSVGNTQDGWCVKPGAHQFTS